MGLTLLLVLGLGGCTSLPLTQGVDPAGQRLVLLFDSSTSMRKNDPDNVALLGGELLMGLVGSRDNVGAITYSDSADVRVPMRPAGGAARRQALRHALKDVERNGITDFAQALERARQMLEEAEAPRGSAVVLLTDGVPYRGRRREVGVVSLGTVVESLQEQGWRIFAIALGEQAQTPFLSMLVAKTGGAVFPVPGPDALLKAFEDVSIEVLGYLRAEREGAVQIAPETGRLAFVGRWSQGGRGAPLAVLRDGEAVAPSRVIQTPKGEAAYSVGLVESPEPGEWSALTKDAEQVVALVEPRFSVEFVAGKPPEQVSGRSQVELAVRLVGKGEGLARLRSRLSVRATLQLNEEPYGGRIKLRPDPSDPLAFVGTFRAPRVDEQASLRVLLEAVIVEGGRPFSLRRSRSLTVKPGGAGGPPPLAIQLSPAQVDIARWVGHPRKRVTFTLRGDPDRSVVVTCGRARVTVPAGESRQLRPRLSRRLRFVARGDDGVRWRQAVSVRARAFGLRGQHAKGIDLPPTPGGLTTGLVALDLQVLPAGVPVLSSGSLLGPGGARVLVEVTPRGLQANPGVDLPPGDYAGALELRVDGVTDLEAYRLPVRLRVLVPLKPPEDIALEGSWGWTSTPVEVALPVREEVPVSIKVSELLGEGDAVGARIWPRLDVRVVPLDGWRGDALGASPRRFALEVFVSSDLPAGTYVGEVAVEIAGDGARSLTIPVRLGVRR